MRTKLDYQQNIYSNFFNVAPGVWGMKDVFVNLYMVLNPFDGNWVLIDAGLKWSVQKIKKMARQLFGDRGVPSSIILTHGHFDHVGSLKKLTEEWNVPVFAHYLEVPYLTGKSSYPPPDPTVGGGFMSLMSWMYPSEPINLWNHINVLPENGRVPGLPEWRYLHTPGHAPGHISLYRENDSVLIAGDAFVTTKAESVFSTLLQTKKISGPPKYFTYDWELAKNSVEKLMALEPEIVATGHGKPLQGAEVRSALHTLCEDFYEEAVPATGRYVDEPAVTNATGVIYNPPNNIDPQKLVIQVLAVTALVAIAYIFSKQKVKKYKQADVLSYEIW